MAHKNKFLVIRFRSVRISFFLRKKLTPICRPFSWSAQKVASWGHQSWPRTFITQIAAGVRVIWFIYDWLPTSSFSTASQRCGFLLDWATLLHGRKSVNQTTVFRDAMRSTKRWSNSDKPMGGLRNCDRIYARVGGEIRASGTMAVKLVGSSN